MKNINSGAPVKCSKDILIDVSPTNVWAVMTNIDNWTKWQSAIRKPKLNGKLKPNSTFDWKMRGAKIHSTLHTVEPFTKFGWKGKILGVSTNQNWTLTDLNGQTLVSVHESMEGFLAVLLKKSFNKTLAKAMENWLVLLKAECEK
ncbi:hypothetical protein BH11BAC5_BH11BAC5_23840 [soil metagenome]